MSGSTPPLHLDVFKACTGTTLSLPQQDFKVLRYIRDSFILLSIASSKASSPDTAV